MTESIPEQADRKRRNRIAYWGFIGGCLAIAAVASLFASDKDDESNTPDATGAESACEHFVEERLKSPSSADFQDATATGAGVNTWSVTGAVDAENSFGAAMRVYYECTVRGTSDGKWTLVDLQHTQR